MSRISKRYWAQKDGTDVYLYTFSNAKGTSIDVSNYGCLVTGIRVPDRSGKMDDITLGLRDADAYLTQNHPYFGALLGRCANRIAKGILRVGGKEYQLSVGKRAGNHMHGGVRGFDKRIWDAEILPCEDGECLELSYCSPDGEENYPGNVKVKIRYSLSEDNAFKIQYFAETDADTPVNLSNHIYFNLSGHASGNVLDQQLKMYTHKFAPVEESPIQTNCIPTGEIRDVAGTGMDFTSFRPIRQGFDMKDEQVAICEGYDHCWPLDSESPFPVKAAEAYDPASGRALTIFTDMPCLRLYTANILNVPSVNVHDLKDGVSYGHQAGFVIDPQYMSDAVNHPNFKSPVLKPGERFHHTTIYQFSVRD